MGLPVKSKSCCFLQIAKIPDAGNRVVISFGSNYWKTIPEFCDPDQL